MKNDVDVDILKEKYLWVYYNKQTPRNMIQNIEVNFLALLIISEYFAVPFSFFLPPFPYWELEIRIVTSLYRATDEEHHVRIRVKVKLVLFTFHCNELGSSLVSLILLCYLYFCPTAWCALWQKDKSSYMYSPQLEKEGHWLHHQHTWLFLARLHIKCCSDSLEILVQHEFYHI